MQLGTWHWIGLAIRIERWSAAAQQSRAELAQARAALEQAWRRSQEPTPNDIIAGEEDMECDGWCLDCDGGCEP